MTKSPAAVSVFGNPSPVVNAAARNGSLRYEELAFERVNAYCEQIASMTATLLDGAPPIITLDDSRANVATLDALARSAAAGASVMMNAP